MSDSVLADDALQERVESMLRACDAPLRTEFNLHAALSGQGLGEDVDRVYIAESDGGAQFAAQNSTFAFHIYRPCPVDNIDEFDVGDADSEGSATVAATLSELPNRGLDGVWENLVYSDDVKARLLHYIYTTMKFATLGIDQNVITCNRVVLLHGPPGTGKTSLCRALAQKLAIRFAGQYTHGKLIEINSHSLFSKWFSESGKLVHRLFELIGELVNDRSGFVVVLIDEIESLSKARGSVAAGVEPSDSIRVVNALLTELDKLKGHTNLLVMTTSNLSESIDSAFLDRVDIRQYIGLPGTEAVYRILRSCLEELMHVGLVLPRSVPSWASLHETFSEVGAALKELAEACTGISGRALRRLPVLAHARYLYASAQSSPAQWIDAMWKVHADMRRDAERESAM
ncbi:hypothetical protein MVES1_001905 [Malassezia vespertilionis]|uniref:AAA+ ATPase domain-containing protein n=1 Tax=Malassezia vespertilionis TaxID=2020962 RepID=A0A2N1JD26_9BASI|nr:uncharacterized protein MVES1_001905 [Malassezia vespertilionis]PKI84470.1 hypothetical protein MVES_001807 [Malassezia vespertilionis]WFD06554.1 hypothetical protein MVES1_001905 [Malassezia vespertilionis]